MIANSTDNWKQAVPNHFLPERTPGWTVLFSFLPGHFPVLRRKGSCLIMTGLSGLSKGRMELMQSYGTVCLKVCPCFHSGDFLKMLRSTGLSGSCGSPALHAQPVQLIDLFGVLKAVFSFSCAAFPPFPPASPILVHSRWTTGNSVAIKHILMDWL